MSKTMQPGEREALGGGDEREALVADGEGLAVLGADVGVGDRLAARPRRRRRACARPASAQVSRSPLAASAVPSGARITQPRRSADIAARRATATSASATLGAPRRGGVWHLGDNSGVSLERASWLAVVAICVIAAILLAIAATAATRSWSPRSARRPRSTCSDTALALSRLATSSAGRGTTPRARCGSARRSAGSRASIAPRTRVGDRVRLLERRPGAELQVQVDVAAGAGAAGAELVVAGDLGRARALAAIAASIRSSSSAGGASSTSTRPDG